MLNIHHLSIQLLLYNILYTVVNAGVIHTSSDNQYEQLVDQVHFLANRIRSGPSPNMVVQGVQRVETTTKPGVHIPGWTNICANLCPKWCRKSPQNHTTYTDCHYTCGNICNHKTREVNPYLGNQAYEVVPSSYQFSDYDLNKDKLLSIQEISTTEQVAPDDIRHLFTFADFNRDGYIDQEEFLGGPFVFTVQMAAELTVVGKSTPAHEAQPDSDSD